MADESVDVQILGSQTLTGPAEQAAAAVRVLQGELEKLNASAAAGVSVPQSAFSRLNEQIAEQIRLTNSATESWQRYAAAASSIPPAPPRSPPGGGGPGGQPYEFSLGPDTTRSISSARDSAATLATSLSAAASADAFFREAELSRAAASAAAAMQGEQAAQRMVGYATGSRAAADAAGVFSQRLGLLSREEVEVSRAQQAMQGEQAAQRLIGFAASTGEVTAATSMFAQGLRTAGAAHTEYVSTLRHGTAILDGLARGQRGQVEASTLALLRDSGAMKVALETLTGPWGAVAAAGVGALAAIGYELEQQTQQILSFRDTLNELAIKGLGDQTGAANQRFDLVANQYHEFAGANRELQEELNKLPAAAQSSAPDFIRLGEAMGRLRNTTAAEGLKEFVQAAQRGPEALAKLVTETFSLQGQTNAAGQTLEEAAASTKDLSQAFALIVASAVAQKIVEIGDAGAKAQKDIRGTAAAMEDLAAAALVGGDAYERAAEKVNSAFGVLGAGAQRSRLPEDIIAQNNAIEAGSGALQQRINAQNNLKAAQDALARLTAPSEGFAQPDATAIARAQEAIVRYREEIEKLTPAEQRTEEQRRATEAGALQAAQANLAKQVELRTDAEATLRAQAAQRLGVGAQSPEVSALPSILDSHNQTLEARRRLARQEVEIENQKDQDIAANQRRGADERLAALSRISERERDARYAPDLGGQQMFTVEQQGSAGRAVAAARRQNEAEQYRDFKEEAELEIQAAKGNVDQIIAIYERLKQRAVGPGAPAGEQARISRAETEAIQHAQQEQFRATEENVNAQNRVATSLLGVQKAQLQAAVVAHAGAKDAELAQEQALTGQVMAQEERRVAGELQADNLTAEQKEKLYEQLAELYAKDAETQAQYQEKITAAIEKENKVRAEAFTNLFDSIGNTLEKTLTGALTGQKANLKEAARGLIGDAVKGIFTEGSHLAAGPLANLFGVKAPEGAGVGQVLGLGLEKMLGLYKPPEQTAQEKIAGLQENAAKALDAAGKELSAAARQLTQGRQTATGTGGTLATDDQAPAAAQSAISYALTSQGQKLKDYCAKLVNDSLEQAGVKGSGSNLASSFKNYGSPVASGQERYGDIFYAGPSGQGDTGHVGLVEGPAQNGYVPVVSSHLQGNPDNPAGSEWRSVANLTFRRPDYGQADQTATLGTDPATLNYWRQYGYGLGQKVGAGQMTMGQAGQDIEQATGGQVTAQQLQAAMQQLGATIGQQTTAINSDKSAEDQNTAALKQVKPGGTTAPATSGSGGATDQASPFQQNLGLLTQGLGIASSAAAAFGAHLGTGARMILGAVGVITQLATFIPKVISTFTGATQAAATAAQTTILTTISANTLQTAAGIAVLVAKPSVLGTTLSAGGIVYAAAGFQPKDTDTKPAMLTPGESVYSVGETVTLGRMGVSPGNVGRYGPNYAALAPSQQPAAASAEVSSTFNNSFARPGSPFQTRGDYEEMVRGGAGAFSNHVENELSSRGYRYR
jgi:hypothetical protein